MNVKKEIDDKEIRNLVCCSVSYAAIMSIWDSTRNSVWSAISNTITNIEMEIDEY